MFKQLIAFLIILTFSTSSIYVPQAQAIEKPYLLSLPVPGTMVNSSPSYEPALIKGLTIHKDNPFLFDFIVDTGNSGLSLETTGRSSLREESDRLIKYFFTCLTVPETDLWVNLSPYEKDRIVPEALGETALGRDLLAQDYILKQLTASLIYPEKDLGKEFWSRVYAKAQAMYGSNVQIPVNTFNKVWILADKASVYENGQSVFVVDGHLKIMLEEDYLALQKNHISSPHKGKETSSIGSQIIRDIVLPEIEKEVNHGKNFATLRQIFNSLILASWYKKNLKDSILNQLYSDKNTVKGINLSDISVKDQIYHQYLKAYKKGVFNYIKEDPSTDSQGKSQAISRKYFSGGFGVRKDFLSKASPAMAAQKLGRTTGQDYAMKVRLNVEAPSNLSDQAQIAAAIRYLRAFLIGSILSSGFIENNVNSYQQPETLEATFKEAQNVPESSVQTPKGEITFFPADHVSMDSIEELEKALNSFDKNEANKAIDKFSTQNRAILEGQRSQVEDMIDKIKRNHIKYLSPEGVSADMEGMSMQEVIALAREQYTTLEAQLEKLGRKESAEDLYLGITGPTSFLCLMHGDVLIQQGVELFPIDLPIWGNMARDIKIKLEKQGITGKEAWETAFSLMLTSRNKFMAYRFFQGPQGKKGSSMGPFHTGEKPEGENPPRIDSTLPGEIEKLIEKSKSSPAIEIDPKVESDRKELIARLNADPVFNLLYGDVNTENIKSWSKNGLQYQPLIDIVTKYTLDPMSKAFQISIADPSNLRFVFFESPKNNEFAMKRGHLFTYKVGSRTYILIPLDTFQKARAAEAVAFLLKSALVALMDQDKTVPAMKRDIDILTYFRGILSNYDNNPSFKERNLETKTRFELIQSNISGVEQAIHKDLPQVDVAKLRYYDSKRDKKDPTVIFAQFFDPQTVTRDGKVPFIKVNIIDKPGSTVTVKQEPGQISNPAMIGEEDIQSKVTPGGIDLNTTDMSMAVTKDAGGVKMNLPARGWSASGGDSAMLERIKVQGVFSATPVIIEITPVSSLRYK